MELQLDDSKVGLILAGLVQLEKTAQLRGNATTAVAASKLYEEFTRAAAKQQELVVYL